MKSIKFVFGLFFCFLFTSCFFDKNIKGFSDVPRMNMLKFVKKCLPQQKFMNLVLLFIYI